ncbi:unnamed protein product [Chrysoparadoxa australica]
MCNLEAVQRDKIPMIRRFSGGGTVIVDEDTLFTTLICNDVDVPDCKPFPRDIMDFSKTLFGPALQLAQSPLELGLRENDYVFGDLKFGGNAQAITKNRWLHHTSFLWDFDPKLMEYLAMPAKRPEYRGDRNHREFLTPLKGHLMLREGLVAGISQTLAATGRFDVRESSLEEVETILTGLGGKHSWISQCRTTFVGGDGSKLATPQEQLR